MARPFFAWERISDFDLFERHSMRTLSIMSSFASSDHAFDAQDLYSRFTLDTASEFLFGKNLNTLSGSLPTPGEGIVGAKGSVTTDSWGSFAQAFEEMQQIVTNRRRLGYIWPLFELLGDKTAPHVKVIRNFLDPIVNQVLAERERRTKSGVHNSIDQKTFMEHLAESTQGMRSQNPHFIQFYSQLTRLLVKDASLIRDQLLSVLLASRDTVRDINLSGNTLISIFPCLINDNFRQQVF